jgi:hypothetical protein
MARSTPPTAACSIGGLVVSMASMACGAMYLPVEVLMRSLTRPVMMMQPASSMAPASPVQNQPSRKTSAVASGLR